MSTGANCLTRTRWRNFVEDRLDELQATLQELLRRSQLEALPSASIVLESHPSVGVWAEHTTPMTDDASPLQGIEAVAEPMQSVIDVAGPRQNDPRYTIPSEGSQDDLIHAGILSIVQAEQLFDLFSQKMNQYLWGGTALVHVDLGTTRRSSTLLSTVVLTVVSLHVAGDEELFDRCCSKLTTFVAKTMISAHHTLDSVRALIIGAFWLYEWSWKLSGLAVRIATELELHHAFQQLRRDSADAFEKVQLWYLLYVCDHHFSIAYGRPPKIYTTPAIREHQSILTLPQAGPKDYRIISQVAIFQCLNDAYGTFKVETPAPLQESDFSKLHEFNLRIEQWRVHWQNRLSMLSQLCMS